MIAGTLLCELYVDAQESVLHSFMCQTCVIILRWQLFGILALTIYCWANSYVTICLFAALANTDNALSCLMSPEEFTQAR